LHYNEGTIRVQLYYKKAFVAPPSVGICDSASAGARVIFPLWRWTVQDSGEQNELWGSCGEQRRYGRMSFERAL